MSARTRSRPPRPVAARSPRDLNVGNILGPTVALSILLALPTSTIVKAMVVVSGAAALTPWVFVRVRECGRPKGIRLLMILAAWGLAGWAVVSAFASQAPWAVSLFGWYGRDVGVLLWVASAIAFTAAVYMSAQELRTTLLWIAGAAVISALVSLVQALGWSGLTTTYGYDGYATTFMNPNFASAFFAIMAVLSVTSWTAKSHQSHRLQVFITVAAFTVLMLIGLRLAGSDQGYVAALVGLAGVIVGWGLTSDSRSGRTFGWASGALLVVAAGASVLAVISRVSLPGVNALVDSLALRTEYWKAAWQMLLESPLAGTGPDGYGRYFAEFRSQRYLDLVGGTSLADAAHNIPLNVGATLGVPGLLVWTFLFGSGLVLGFVTLSTRRNALAETQQRWLLVGMWAGLGSYATQALVSIDQPSLTVIGWTLCGGIVGVATSLSGIEPSTRPHVARTSRTAVLATFSCALAVIAAVVYIPAILGSRSAHAMTAAEAQERALSSLTPCPLRLAYLDLLMRSVPVAEVSSVAQRALALDPRCPSVAELAADVAFRNGDLEQARKEITWAVEIDPLNPRPRELQARIRNAP